MKSKAPKNKKTSAKKVAKKQVVKKKSAKKKASKKVVAAKPAKPVAAKNVSKKKSVAEKKTVKKPLKKSVSKVAKPKLKAVAKPKVAAKVGKAAKPKKSTAKVVTKKVAAKKPAKILRPKSFEQIPAARNHGFPENIPDLPENYLRDRLVLMTQEPDYLFSYWELTTAQLTRKSAAKRKGEQYSEALRLNWPQRSLFDQGFVILPVSLSARRWYLQVPFPGLSYQVEIGWLSSQGEFISILTSNESDAPESWMETQKRLRGTGGEILSRVAIVASPSGSSEQMLVEETILASLNWTPGSSSSSAMR